MIADLPRQIATLHQGAAIATNALPVRRGQKSASRLFLHRLSARCRAHPQPRFKVVVESLMVGVAIAASLFQLTFVVVASIAFEFAPVELAFGVRWWVGTRGLAASAHPAIRAGADGRRRPTPSPTHACDGL